MKKILFISLFFLSVAVSAQTKNLMDWTPATAQDSSFNFETKGNQGAVFVTVYSADSLWFKLQHSAHADSLYCDVNADSVLFSSGTATKAIEWYDKTSKYTKAVINQVGGTKADRILIDYVYSR